MKLRIRSSTFPGEVVHKRELDPVETNNDTPRATPLHVVAALLEFAADHPEREVVVYGHADTAGDAGHNAALSEQRARNVQLYLASDREGWAAHCQEHYEIADFKRVHRWAAERFAWATDPGPLDNQWTSTAVATSCSGPSSSKV